jgi:hypothetical protein
MKKGNAKKRGVFASSFQSGKLVSKNAKKIGGSRHGTVLARRIITVDYSKALSYIIRTEEDETDMMVATSKKVALK